jgi:hypothetical protein
MTYDECMEISLELEKLEVKQDNWISVTDRLPEFHKKVLFYHQVMDGIFLGSFIKGSYKFRDATGDSFYNSDITHWQPLPAPPS